ncbi:hypothetical protein lerEdw1_014891, partial [Lerista edwardsae]
FKTEEEMLSYLTARYQKAVDDEEILFACVQEMVTAISAFLKSSGSKPREMACADIIRSCLLKTSKAIRQPLGGSPEKESKVKEYEAQYSASKLVNSDPRGMLLCHTKEFLQVIME